MLYPDNTAIMIIKMDLIDFEIDPSGCEFDVIAMYDVFLENGQCKELQTHLATIKIDSDILHDERYSVRFDTNKCEQKFIKTENKRQMNVNAFRLFFECFIAFYFI